MLSIAKTRIDCLAQCGQGFLLVTLQGKRASQIEGPEFIGGAELYAKNGFVRVANSLFDNNDASASAFGHAAINGISALGTMVVQGEPNPLIGPMPVGLIGAVAWALLAAWIMVGRIAPNTADVGA